MASQAGGLVQDQNFAHTSGTGPSVGSKTNVSKAVRKGGLGGRKPLGDLSNSLKPKTQNPNIFSSIEKELAVKKITNDASKKGSKKITNDNEKLQIGNRKALLDISNSGKPELHKGSKKSSKTKLSVFAEETIHDGALTEERFLHNHQECIKAQRRAMDMDQFLNTVGLDSGLPRRSPSPRSSPVFNKTKPESSWKTSEMDEMAEHRLIDDPSHSNLHLSPPCKTPGLINHDHGWKDDEFVNFELMDTPAFPKH